MSSIIFFADKLAEIRVYLERIQPIEKKLKYQIDKMLKVASTGAADKNDPSQFRANPSSMALEVPSYLTSPSFYSCFTDILSQFIFQLSALNVNLQGVSVLDQREKVAGKNSMGFFLHQLFALNSSWARYTDKISGLPTVVPQNVPIRISFCRFENGQGFLWDTSV